VKQEEDDEGGLGSAEVTEEDADMKMALNKAIQSAMSHIKDGGFKHE
jgi:hypothetical protein